MCSLLRPCLFCFVRALLTTFVRILTPRTFSGIWLTEQSCTIRHTVAKSKVTWPQTNASCATVPLRERHARRSNSRIDHAKFTVCCRKMGAARIRTTHKVLKCRRLRSYRVTVMFVQCAKRYGIMRYVYANVSNAANVRRNSNAIRRGTATDTTNSKRRRLSTR